MNQTEVYLARDIIQGENAPFYILWDKEDIEYIKVLIDGFDSVIEYFNVKDNLPIDTAIKISDLKTPIRYIGGLLKTSITSMPYKDASLTVCFGTRNADEIFITEKRFLYNTNVEEIYVPHQINLPLTEEKPIQITVRGKPTIFIDVKSADDSPLLICLPPENQTDMEQMVQLITEGVEKLKKKHPIDCTIIEHIGKIVIDSPMPINIPDILETVYSKYGVISDDVLTDFIELIENTLLKDTNFISKIFLPILRYWAESTGEKSYLVNPLVCVEVPKGGGKLKAEFSYTNIIGGVKRINFETNFESLCNQFIPIRDLIAIKRIEFK